jgi:hypothetical protein
MKKQTFITIFIGAHILFASLQIYKQNEFTKRAYEHQRKQHMHDQLIEKRNDLKNKKCALASHTDIKRFAHSQGLEPISITKQVKKLDCKKIDGCA